MWTEVPIFAWIIIQNRDRIVRAWKTIGGKVEDRSYIKKIKIKEKVESNQSIINENRSKGLGIEVEILFAVWPWPGKKIGTLARPKGKPRQKEKKRLAILKFYKNPALPNPVD